MNERNTERNIDIKSSLLLKLGGIISFLGSLIVVEGIALERGALGSLGLFIGGLGVSLILTGIRSKTN